MKQKSVIKYQCANGDWHNSPEDVHCCNMYFKLQDLWKGKRIVLHTAHELMGSRDVLVVIASFLIHNSLIGEQLIQEHLDSLAKMEPTK